MKKIDGKTRGVTLVELMIVLLLLSLVMMSIYSLYITHQRTAYTQDEVVEVQQNLRIGMESITRDIRMAGFLIPYTNTPVSVTYPDQGAQQPLDNANSDAITITTASASATVARLLQPPAGAVFTIDDPRAVTPFNPGDVVTIIRPGNRIQPAGTGSWFTIAPNGINTAVPSITLTATPGGMFVAGDLIVGLGAGGIYPNTVTYCLGPSPSPAALGAGGCGNGVTTCPAGPGQLCLMRIVNGNAQPIAQNIAGLQISYLLDNGTETSTPNPAINNSTIRSVRVTLFGQTATTTKLSGNVPKVRRLDSVIMIRNR